MEEQLAILQAEKETNQQENLCMVRENEQAKEETKEVWEGEQGWDFFEFFDHFKKFKKQKNCLNFFQKIKKTLTLNFRPFSSNFSMIWH